MKKPAPIRYVNVPRAPGVPQVLFAPTAAAPSFISDAEGAAQEASIQGSLGRPAWGLYSGGVPVITADIVESFDYRNESAVADFPIERGGFESYNKVAEPFDVRLRFVSGGSVNNRAALLDSIEAVAGTLQLFDAVTPEAIYMNVNVVGRDYRRSAQSGAGLLRVDVLCREIRADAVEGTGQPTTQTKEPSGAPTVNTGFVQGVEPTAAQKAVVPT